MDHSHLEASQIGEVFVLNVSLGGGGGGGGGGGKEGERRRRGIT